MADMTSARAAARPLADCRAPQAGLALGIAPDPDRPQRDCRKPTGRRRARAAGAAAQRDEEPSVYMGTRNRLGSIERRFLEGSHSSSRGPGVHPPPDAPSLRARRNPERAAEGVGEGTPFLWFQVPSVWGLQPTLRADASGYRMDALRGWSRVEAARDIGRSEQPPQERRSEPPTQRSSGPSADDSPSADERPRSECSPGRP
jgi:hypothetical protein